VSYQLIRGDATSIPLADGSVDEIVTSPPYFALRSYTDGGEHYDGQIGSEATPQAFLEALWAVTAECRRVLKPSGSMFVNLGDKYSGVSPGSYRRHTQPFGPNGDTATGYHEAAAASEAAAGHDPDWGGIPAKSLMMLPQRYAIGCIDQLGLILRAEIIWSKPNGLPESVTDRVRRSHEQWFHFTKEPRYFSAVDEVREAHMPGRRSLRGRLPPDP
jgi:DNA modification methylase